jgi:hypothetical protein
VILSALVASYVIATGSVQTTHVEVNFEGWVPIFGGKEGKATAKMTVVAKGIEPIKGMPATEAEVTEIEAIAFGSKLPLNKNNVSQFFPKAVVSFKPTGQVVSNSAPDIKMPVRLPGLDSKRLPEISYLPIELPEGEATLGLTYSFRRDFGGVPVEYAVKVESVDAKNILLSLKLAQNVNGFEDAYGNPTEETNAKKKLEVKLDGTGSALFNREISRFDYVMVNTNTSTKVIPIGKAKGSETTRNLKMNLKITREGIKVD